jgi:hypothetical protein
MRREQFRPESFIVIVGMMLGVIAVALLHGLYALIGLSTGWEDLLFDQKVSRGLIRIEWIVQLVIAFFCGMARSRRHPIFDDRYRSWLETTPWDSSKPLPMGSVQMQLWDWLSLAAWTALAWSFLDRPTLHLPVVFLLAYLGHMLEANFKTEEESATLVLAFGLSGIIRLWQDPVAALALALALYLVGYVGLRRGLKRFPWPQTEKPLVGHYGWPLQQLGPFRKEMQVTFSGALAVSLLVGWWLYAIAYNGPSVRSSSNEIALVCVTFVAFVSLAAALIRLGIYITGYASPISLWGRLATGRLIIPSHDNAWLSAALIPVIGIASQMALTSLGLRPMHSVPLSCAALIFAALTLPPSRRHYQLTGEHRMIEPTIRGMPSETRPAHVSRFEIERCGI